MKENLGKENSYFITHPSSLYLKVRMGLHTGTAEILPDGKYEGYATIASTQRVMSAAHGGQTLLTQTTHDLLQNALPDDVTLRDMGEHRLKDLEKAVAYVDKALDPALFHPPGEVERLHHRRRRLELKRTGNAR